MADEKLTQLTSLAGAQVPTDLMYIVDLSEVLPADQSKSTTVADLFNYYNKNTTDGSFQMQGIAAPGLSGAGNGKIYFDSTSNTFKVSQNGGAFFDLGNIAGSFTSGQVAYANGTNTLTGNAGLTFTPNALTLGTAASPGGFRLVSLTGFYWNLSTQNVAANKTLYLPDSVTPTTGNLLFISNSAAQLTSDWTTGLTWSNTTKQLTVTASLNDVIGLGIQNTNSGTAAQCQVGFTANGGAISLISLTGTGFSTSGLYKANQLYWRGTTGITEMLFALDDASTAFKFGVNNAVAASINATSTEGLVLGIASSLTGRIKLFNSAGATYTQISAGNAASNLNYILPATSPTAGQFLQAGAPSGGNVTLTWATGSGGGAPADASYLVLGLNGTLTDERVFTLADTTLVEVDGGAGGNYTLGVNQANAFAWTAAHTWNTGTGQTNALSITKSSIGSVGQRDSDRLLFGARANNGSDYAIEARQYINVVSNDGVGSLFTIDGRNTFAGAGFNTLFTLNISSGNIVTPGTLTSGTALAVTGALNLCNSGSANVTTLQAGAAASALTFVWPIVDPTAGQVLSASAPSGGTVTLSWAAAGGGTTINSTNGQLPYRVNGTTFGDSAFASNALNSTYLQATSGASGAGLTLTVAGGGSNENLILAAKGTGSITSSFNYITAGATIGYYTYLSSSGLEGISGGVTLKVNGTQILGINYLHNYALVRSDGGFGWSSDSTLTGSPDTGFIRSAAGVIRATNGSTGASQLLIGTSTDTVSAQLDVRSQSTTRPAGRFQAASGTPGGQEMFGIYTGADAAGAIFTSSGKLATYSITAHAGSGVDTSWAEMANTTLGFAVGASGSYAFSDTAGNSTTTKDVILSRDAANTLAQRNGANAQTFRVYNTYTDASNYERLNLAWVSNEFQFVNANAGTGSIRSMAFVSAPSASATSRIFSIRNNSLTDLGGFTVGGSLVLTNLGTAPTASVTDACLTYVADAAAGDAQLFARNEAGFVSQLTGNLYTLDQDYPATTTTLANITGGGIYGNLSANVQAGKSYNFRAVLLLDANATGGWKVAMGGTCTATTFRAGVLAWGTSAGLVATLQVTALGSTTTGSGVNAYEIIIEGYISVNAAGTLTVQFAQNSASGTSYVKEGSYFQCWLSNR